MFASLQDVTAGRWLPLTHGAQAQELAPACPGPWGCGPSRANPLRGLGVNSTGKGGFWAELAGFPLQVNNLGAGVGSTNERPGGDACLNKPNMRTSVDPGDGGDPLVIFLGTIKMMGCGEGVTVLLGSVGFRDASAGMQGEVLHLMLETPGGKGRWPLCTAAGVTISECGEAG